MKTDFCINIVCLILIVMLLNSQLSVGKFVLLMESLVYKECWNVGMLESLVC